MNRSLTIAMAFLLCAFPLLAQQKKMKFGKINMQDLAMRVYERDSSAEALVLADKGVSRLKYSQQKGFYLQYTRHKRVKILTKDGYGFADVSIPLYESGANREEVTGFKAATYNLEKGQMVITKIPRKDTFEEKYNENITLEKFTFPDAKEGSILEYSYTVNSDFIFNLQDWAFQDEIPTVWSEYIVEIPEYFTYERFAQGFHGLSISNVEIERDRITLRGKRDAGTTERGRFYHDEIEYTKKVYHWLAENVPAFREEPHMASTENFISKINFELSSTRFPNSPIKRYMGTWADVNNTFLKDENFGKPLNASGFLKDRVEGAISGAASDQEKLQALVREVKSSVNWNKKYGKYLSSNLRQVLKAGEGSAAEINLLLTTMLRKAGFQADPVLISTRSHGMVREQFALSSQFNYVVCAVEMEGKTVILDATDKTLPANLIPQRCLNGRGWRVSQRNPGWVNITSGGWESRLVLANLELTEDGLLKGKADILYRDYAARRVRSNYHNAEGDYQQKTGEAHGWQINEMEVKGIDDLNKGVSLKLDLETSHGVEMLGDVVYLNPFISEQVEENPFKLEDRQFPVDFISPVKSSYMLTLKVPEGFVVDELPKSEVITIPAGAAKFQYYSLLNGDTISLRCTLSINKSVFPSTEYPYLRQFYIRLVEKQAEHIVLKRKTE